MSSGASGAVVGHGGRRIIASISELGPATTKISSCAPAFRFGSLNYGLHRPWHRTHPDSYSLHSDYPKRERAFASALSASSAARPFGPRADQIGASVVVADVTGRSRQVVLTGSVVADAAAGADGIFRALDASESTIKRTEIWCVRNRALSAAVVLQMPITSGLGSSVHLGARSSDEFTRASVPRPPRDLLRAAKKRNGGRLQNRKAVARNTIGARAAEV